MRQNEDQRNQQHKFAKDGYDDGARRVADRNKGHLAGNLNAEDEQRAAVDAKRFRREGQQLLIRRENARESLREEHDAGPENHRIGQAGFEQGEKDGCKEWPIPDASTLSWQGKPLAYMPFVYAHPEYYHKIEEETKGSGDITRSTHLFIDSEKAREHTEEEMIKVENIKGKLIMVGADDDSFWEAGKYVRRMDKRLKERPHECDYEALTYEHGTHFVLPETMLRKALPVGLKFVMKFIFKAAKDYPKECEQTRKDIDRRLSAALKQWVAE
mgnify:CR=1 FL=1